MKEFVNYLEKNRVAVMSMLIMVLILFGIFSKRNDTGTLSTNSYNAMCMQNGGCPRQLAHGPQAMPQRNYYPYSSMPACPMMSPFGQGQQIALQSNTLTLPIGVTLAGRGTVVSVEPGSAAQRAGIQEGDLINRINGK